MQSFHRSRGRILFEVFCALGISASFVGAWMQTGASALLGAAFVAALYGLWHLTDLGGRKPRIEVDRGEEAAVEDLAPPQFEEPVAPAQVLELAEAVEETPPPAPAMDIVQREPAPSSKSEAKRPRARRKNGGRRAGDPKEAKVTEHGAPEEPAIDEPATAVEAEPIHLAPLFQPEPFVRQQQRALFGRKAGFGRR